MARGPSRPDERLLPAPRVVRTLREQLLAWYDLRGRDLPWRSRGGEVADPYRVWLSEVMLQQTRVATVRPYFERWLERFPTLAALARAEPDDVLKAWEGLGYYSRARNLHRAVREVQARWGRVPDDPSAFRALPGVGRYTAGAVMSIAFGRQEPVVDGNVRRVFARWLDLAAPPEPVLWALADRLVRGERPGELNQALMELGATVCAPRTPRCGVCPVAETCAARRRGTQAQRPAARRAGPLPHEDTAVAVLVQEGRLLLARRFPRGRLGGLWGFPAAVRHPGESAAAGAERALLEGLRLAARAERALGTVSHTFTHVRATYHAVRCTPLEGEPDPAGYEAWSWVSPADLARYALPVAERRIAALACAAL